MESLTSAGSILALLAIGYVLFKKFINKNEVKSSQVEFKAEDKVLEFKKKELIVDLDKLKKELAEKENSGKTLTPEEIEQYWKDKK